ncbi:MAG: type VII secretion protein EssC, partial [Streptococcaceae bacterium]|nr:type VII secretion protein EssC [Streptococcaceae bacterium]
GYGGVDYNPHGKTEEQIDERIFKINPSGQWELLYDPQEEKVEQKIVAEDFPTQLEAVIEEIGRVFETSTYVQPDRPWLPNLGEMLVSVQPEQKAERNLSIPLGLLDIPSLQAQKVYNYNLEETSHTVIFSSPGFGKSTTLQTIVMNLARQNTPEQVQFNLLDFGTNGLLPLKDLPHVADIVTLEENEKLQKMLGRLSENLAQRKALFKKEGVANLAQYQSKIGQQLPILVSVLDSYDGLTPQEPKKEAIDYLLLQLIREGASLGMYLVMTSGRVGAIRMNMMANIQTKMAFYLNDESELVSIMGRNRLAQADIVGRGQIMQEAPTAIQFYLPTTGKNAMEILENMSDEIEKLNHDWKGSRPTPIPMAPEKLTNEVFDEHDEVKKWRKEQKLPLGMSYQTTNILGFIPKVHPYFLFASMDDEQNYVFQQIFLQQLSKIQTDVLVVDFIESFEEILNEQKLSENISLITDKNEAKAITKGMIDYVQLVKKKETGKPMLLVISDLQDFTKQTGISARDFIVLLKNTYKAGLDILIFSPHEYIAKSFDEVPKAIRQLKFAGLIGARIYDSPLLKGNCVSSEQELTLYDAYFVVKGGASFDKLKLPQTVKGEENE